MSYITIFVILLVAVFATIAYFTEPSEADKRIQERLAALVRTTHDEHEAAIVRDVTFSNIRIVDGFLRRTRMAPELKLMLEQAKIPWTVGRFFFFSAVLFVLGAVLGNWRIPMGYVGWIPGIVLGFVPFGAALYKRSRRMNDLNKLLPAAVDLMARALRAGYSLPSSLVMVAEEVEEPLGSEFRRTADELNFGLPFREALINLQNRYPLEDLRFLVTAILLQKETGGNLVELLDKIAALLRARIHLKQKVQVYTAQGRITGVILAAMPFVCFMLLNFVKPGYTRPLFDSEMGLHMVYGALVAMVIGIIMIRRIINIQV